MKAGPRSWIVYTGIGAVLFGSYQVIGRMHDAPPEVLMPRWVPFFPVLALPYLLQLVVSWFLLLAVHDKKLRRACLYAYLATIAVTSLIWLLYPTVMFRPALAEGWWNFPFRVMARLDRPTNVLPCGHILMPVLITWSLALERPRWLWWLVPCQVLGAIAIVTTWQHRPVDLAIGIAIALTGGLIFGIGRHRPTIRR